VILLEKMKIIAIVAVLAVVAAGAAVVAVNSNNYADHTKQFWETVNS